MRFSFFYRPFFLHFTPFLYHIIIYAHSDPQPVKKKFFAFEKEMKKKAFFFGKMLFALKNYVSLPQL